MTTSTYIFNDGNIKSRLIKKDRDWYVAEYKSTTNENEQWFPWISGTYDFLSLTEQDKLWAK